MEKLAVIIPSYKPQEYLRTCLESLDAQTLAKEDFCVYLALNGPRERYEPYVTSLLEHYSFTYRYHYLEEAGVSAARNYLLDVSTEDYIAFVDDDDFVNEHYLEGLLSASSCSRAGVANIKEFTSKTGRVEPHYIGRCYARIHGVEHSKLRGRQYYSSPWGKVLHRSMVGSTRFDSTVHKGEDSLFMAEISTGIEALQKPEHEAIYYVRERPLSVTNKSAEKKQEVVRLLYLFWLYTKLSVSSGYNRAFMFTRLAATLRHLGQALK